MFQDGPRLRLAGPPIPATGYLWGEASTLLNTLVRQSRTFGGARVDVRGEQVRLWRPLVDGSAWLSGDP